MYPTGLRKVTPRGLRRMQGDLFASSGVTTTTVRGSYRMGSGESLLVGSFIKAWNENSQEQHLGEISETVQVWAPTPRAGFPSRFA